MTAEWWDDLWLNEGFARYYDFVSLHDIRPDWSMNVQQVEYMFQMLNEDGRRETRPVVVTTGKPTEIDKTIDQTITYGKASHIIRMLSYILGVETFDKAIVVSILFGIFVVVVEFFADSI